jgi:hypothetical protein
VGSIANELGCKRGVTVTECGEVDRSLDNVAVAVDVGGAAAVGR